MLTGRRILVVDDETVFAENLREYFTVRRAEVMLASTGAAALKLASVFAPEVAVADDRLAGMDGIATLRALRSQSPGLLCILVTDRSGEAVVREAQDAGITEILDKPFPLAALAGLISGGRHDGEPADLAASAGVAAWMRPVRGASGENRAGL